MTTVTGSLGNRVIQGAFQSGQLLITSFTDTTVIANNVTFTGTGFTYTSFVQGGITFYQPTGGTITGITNGSQTWSGFSVPLVTAFNNILNANAFNDLFFSGDDLFTGTYNSGGLYAGAGNDTINISNYSFPFGNPETIDGGSGTDTINLAGGLALYGPGSNFGRPNFLAVNVETINLAAGANYSFIADINLVTSGNALTINASALGAGNSLNFSTASYGGNFSTIAGNLTLIGGAGNDVFQGGKGSNVFNGGAGSDTVSFESGDQSTGVTVNLSISGPQAIGSGGWGGTDTFISIENLIGSFGNDTLTGDANNNILMGNGGNDVLDGGAGSDTAVFSGARSNYTIRHVGLATRVIGAGSATLRNMESMAFSDQTAAVTLGSQRNDFGGDTRSDVLWQKSDGTLVIWNMDAAGNVASSPNLGVVDPSIYELIGTGDYNGDRKTDILLRNKNDGTLTEWLMNGTVIDSTINLGVMDSTWSLRGSGDFNGDGITDLVWHSTANGVVQAWQMNASGGVASTPVLTSKDPAFTSVINVGDYNGDGLSDLLLRDGDGVVYGLLTNGVYSSYYYGRMGAAWSLKGSGDFNGDGTSDLLWQKSDGTVQIWQMNVDGFIGSKANLGVVDPAVWSLSVSGDYNGDDKADILLRNANGAVYNWLMNGSVITGSNSLGTMNGTWNIIPPVPPSPAFHTSNDFGADGRADILWHKADGTVVLWTMSASGAVAGTTTVTTVDPTLSSIVAIGDLNNDGKADVILRNADGSYTEWQMNGAAIANTITLPAIDSSWSLKGAADFNGDSQADLLWQRSNGTVAIWFTNNGGITSTLNLGVSKLAVAGTGDYNGDGLADMLLRDTTSGAVRVWLHDGDINNAKSLDPVDSSWFVRGSGDFNGDGVTDILWQNSSGFTVIWQMNASGALGSAASLGILNPNDWSISAVGDYNGDGMSDIMLRNTDGSVANWLMNGATVVTGNGLGTMAGSAVVTPPPLTVTMPQVYRFNDFGADGKADMLWHKADGTVLMWQMNGSGTVAAMPTVTTVDPALYSLVATGDFNGDGKADILLQKTDGTVTEWLMNGATIAGTKTLTAMDSSWSVRGTGDFNADGVTDILWQKLDGSTAFWFMHTDGTIASTDTTGSSYQYLNVGDYNGDGHADFLGRDANGWVRSWLMNDHYYYAQPVDLGAMDSSWSIKGGGDFGGDGKADILWQKTDGTVLIWQMNANGTIASTSNLGVLNPSTWSLSGVADYNGDGKADIQLRNANGTVYNWLMNGATIADSKNLGAMASSALAAPPPFAPPAPVLQVANDFDGGGKADLLWHKADGTVVLWQMGGAGTVATATTVTTVSPAVSSIVGVGDYSGDGKADVLLHNADNSVTEWVMNGATIASTNNLGNLDQYWSLRGSGDFNGDGKVDLLWQKADGSAAIWFMNVNSVATIDTSIGTNANDQYISVGDYNGDGKADILRRNTVSGAVTSWLKNGAATIIGNDLGTMDSSWSVKGSGDFGGDGKADILWQKSDGTVVIWQMNASGFIASSTNLGVLNPATWSISAGGDYNGDGKVEIQLRNSDGNT